MRAHIALIKVSEQVVAIPFEKKKANECVNERGDKIGKLLGNFKNVRKYIHKSKLYKNNDYK